MLENYLTKRERIFTEATRHAHITHTKEPKNHKAHLQSNMATQPHEERVHTALELKLLATLPVSPLLKTLMNHKANII